MLVSFQCDLRQLDCSILFILFMTHVFRTSHSPLARPHCSHPGQMCTETSSMAITCNFHHSWMCCPQPPVLISQPRSHRSQPEESVFFFPFDWRRGSFRNPIETGFEAERCRGFRRHGHEVRACLRRRVDAETPSKRMRVEQEVEKIDSDRTTSKTRSFVTRPVLLASQRCRCSNVKPWQRHAKVLPGVACATASRGQKRQLAKEAGEEGDQDFSSARERVLKQVLQEINSQFGKGSIMTIGDGSEATFGQVYVPKLERRPIQGGNAFNARKFLGLLLYGAGSDAQGTFAGTLTD